MPSPPPLDQMNGACWFGPVHFSVCLFVCLCVFSIYTNFNLAPYNFDKTDINFDISDINFDIYDT